MMFSTDKTSSPSGSSERVDIGDEAERWSNFKREIGAESNETAAKLLLDRYIRATT